MEELIENSSDYGIYIGKHTQTRLCGDANFNSRPP
jgi:hypothetical protein